MTEHADNLVVGVDGTELALLVASTFVLMGWPFERTEAQALATEPICQRAYELRKTISRQTIAAWSDAGVWKSPTGTWTRDLIQRRSAVRSDLRLNREETENAILALRATHAEFRADWGEFCVATPGNIDWYSATPQSLLDLADKLDKLVTSAGD